MPDAASDAGGPHLEPAEPLQEIDTSPSGEAMPLDPRWWGAVTLPVGGVARWRAGPSTVHAERRAADWRLWFEPGPDAYAVVAERPRRTHDDAPEGPPSARFSFAETPDTVTVKPALADRPVIVRPESTLSLPPGERVTMYVGAPVWMALKAEVRRTRRGRKEAAPVVLTEWPTFRPSDTWFGPSTREGELCYAIRTSARLEVADLPLRPHRAVTPVTIENQGATTLVVDRIAVPMPFLALYADRHGRLWSDTVTWTRQADGDTIVKIAAGAPASAERLADPRDARSFGQAITQTFSRLLRGEFR